MKKAHEKEELGADGTPSGVEIEFSHILFEPFDPASISIEAKVVPMDHLLRRLRQGSIRLAPAFQRKYVWDQERSSQLIESLMLRIPLPMFYVAANEDGSWDVVDGLQRLTTIRNFLLGEELDHYGEKIIPQAEPFSLTKLEFWGEKFNDKTFSEMESNQAYARIVNNIMETELRFTVINPATPEEVKRNIFKRINTGGMPLTSQEIRHALYQGHSTVLLKEMAELASFKDALGQAIDDSRMAGRELILRFLAFLIRDSAEYDGDMDKFLSDSMRIINCAPGFDSVAMGRIFKGAPVPKIKKWTRPALLKKFNLAMTRCHDFFGAYAFRKSVPDMRRPPINKALFEAWSNIFANMSISDYTLLSSRKNEFFESYYDLLLTQEFDRSISRDSSTVSGVNDRYKNIKLLVTKTLEGS